MLGRLVLIALQLAVAFFAAPQALRYLSVGGHLQSLVHGAVFAVLVWGVGLIGAQVLKAVPKPTLAASARAMIGGLVGAALIIAEVPAMIPLQFPQLFLPLGLAVLGYHLKR